MSTQSQPFRRDQQPLILAISSRTLFNLEKSNQVYETKGESAYTAYQIEREDSILKPGSAFYLIEKLLKLKDEEGQSLVEVILLSRNSADTGLRVFHSIQHYGLPITRAVFTCGRDPYRYLSAFGAHLFLSANEHDVRHALDAGFAAAKMMLSQAAGEQTSDELRIAFDGDAVLFSDEAERVFQAHGVEAFLEAEASKAEKPLKGGPFSGFLSALHQLQKRLPEGSPAIRTALITARGAPSHERVIKTLRAWNIRLDEMCFLGGLKKAEFLNAFKADIFFDDQQKHLLDADTASAHVPHGVCNEDDG